MPFRTLFAPDPFQVDTSTLTLSGGVTPESLGLVDPVSEVATRITRTAKEAADAASEAASRTKAAFNSGDPDRTQREALATARATSRAASAAREAAKITTDIALNAAALARANEADGAAAFSASATPSQAVNAAAKSAAAAHAASLAAAAAAAVSPADPPAVIPAKDLEQAAWNSVLQRVRDKIAFDASRDDNLSLGPGEVRIGFTLLNVPPQQIKIHEERYNTSYPGLRTNTVALIKSGRGAARIEMDIIFPDKESCNRELREIVSQFRSVPVLPLESPYVVNALFYKNVNLDAESVKDNIELIDEADRDIQSKFDDWVTTLKNLRDDIRGKVDQDPEKRVRSIAGLIRDIEDARSPAVGTEQGGIPKLTAFQIGGFLRRSTQAVSVAAFGIKVRSEFAELVERITNEQIASGRLDPDEIGFDTAQQALVAVLAAAEAKLKAALQSRRLAMSGLAQVNRTKAFNAVQTVTVAFRSISVAPLPKSSDAYRATLTMDVFNLAPFLPVPLFLNDVGDPTPDFQKAVWLDQWIRRNYLLGSVGAHSLTLGRLGDSPRGSIRFTFPTVDVRPVDPREGSSLGNLRFARPQGKGTLDPLDLGAGFVKNGVRYVNVYREFNISEDNPMVSIDDFHIHVENKFASQPVLSTLYPTYQHMGRGNAVIVMKFEIHGHAMGAVTEDDAQVAHDTIMREFHTMKREVEQVALLHGPGIRRRAFTLVEHGMLRLMGIQAVYIDDVNTETKGPAHSCVTIRMLEYTVDQDRREQLGPHDDTGSRKDVTFAAISALIKKHSDLMQVERSNPLGGSADLAIAQFQLLFGGVHLYRAGSTQGFIGPLVPAIFTPRLVTELVLHDPTLSKLLPSKRGLLAIRDFSVLERADREQAPGPTDFTEAQRIARGLIRHWALPRGREGIPSDFPERPTPNMIELAVNLMSSDKRFKDENIATQLAIHSENFSEITGVIVPDDVNRTLSAYPDLSLPTYFQAFSGILKKINTEIRREIEGGVDLIEIADRKSLNLATRRSRPLKNFLLRIFPTFRELGKQPPYGEGDPDDFARGPEDIVDPDFYWFRRATDDPVTIERVKRAIGDKLMPDAPSLSMQKADREVYHKALEQARSVLIGNQTIPLTGTSRFQMQNNGEVRLLRDFEPILTGQTFRSWESNKSMSPLANPQIPSDLRHLQSPDNALQFFEATQALRRDDTWRMSRAFPTIRVFFIRPSAYVEGQDEVVREVLLDDLLGYDAIHSCHVVRHKFFPDTAELEIINVTGNLDPASYLDAGLIRERSSDELAAIALGLDDRNPQDAEIYDRRALEARLRDDIPEREEGEDIQTFTDRLARRLSQVDTEIPFFLQEGTMIQIRMGYDGNTEDLEVIFNGQIAEIEYGDVIRIVAQSHASELTTPINYYEDDDVIGKGEGDLFHAAYVTMAQSPAVHYGPVLPLRKQFASGSFIEDLFSGIWAATRVVGGVVASPFEATGRAIFQDKPTELLSAQIVQGGADTLRGLFDFTRDSIIKSLSDASSRRLENIFVPISEPRLGREFIIPMISGLEVFHELARLIPGFVCLADVPYSTRQTCFLGRPSQYYFAFSEEEKKRETVRWVQDSNKLREERALGNDIAKRVKDLVVDFIKRKAHRTTTRSEFVKPKLIVLRDLRSSIVRIMSHFGGNLEALRYTFGILGSAVATIARSEFGIGSRVELQELAVRGPRQTGIHPIARMAGWRILIDIIMGPLPQDSEAARDSDGRVLSRRGAIPENYFNKAFPVSSETPRSVQFGDLDKLIEFGVESKEYGSSFTFTGSELDRIEILLRKDNALLFRNFLQQFMIFLGDRGASDPDLLQITKVQDSTSARIVRHPRMRPFRQHHLATSLNHIIANNIFTTRDEMANVIHMRYPGDLKETTTAWAEEPVAVSTSTTWKTWRISADRRIPPEDQKHRVITENNVEDTGIFFTGPGESVRLAAYSNMALAVQPMYRGELILRGNAAIKPYDLVWIDDAYNEIRGPVEVESVVHHFTNEDGFVTSVVPHAVVIPNSYTDYSQALANGMRVGLTALGITAAVAGGLVLAPFVPAAVAAVGTTLVGFGSTQVLAALETDNPDIGFWDVVTGNLKTDADKSPIQIIPLTLRGVPWTAGLVGTGSWNRYRMSDEERSELAWKGLDIVWRRIVGISEPKDDYYKGFSSS